MLLTPDAVTRFFADGPSCPDTEARIERTANGAVVATVSGIQSIGLLECQRFALFVMHTLDCALVPEVELREDQGGLTVRVTAYAARTSSSAPASRVGNAKKVCALLLVLLAAALWVLNVAWWLGVPPAHCAEQVVRTLLSALWYAATVCGGLVLRASCAATGVDYKTMPSLSFPFA